VLLLCGLPCFYPIFLIDLLLFSLTRLSCSSAPLALHSFPTRRSSDLFLSDVFAAPELMPDWLGTIAAWNPISATATAVRYGIPRSEEHTSEPSHVSISYAVFCLKKKTYAPPDRVSRPPPLHDTRNHSA